METPGYSNIPRLLIEYVWDGMTDIPVEPLVIDRLISFAHRLGNETPGTTYAHHFIEAFGSTYGSGALIPTKTRDLISGLIEAYMTPGSISDVENTPLKDILWDHFKGGVYRTNRLERDADTGLNRVSYDALFFENIYDSVTSTSPNSRRVEQWNEVVRWPDGKYRSRFVFRGGADAPEPSFKVHKAP